MSVLILVEAQIVELFENRMMTTIRRTGELYISYYLLGAIHEHRYQNGICPYTDHGL